MAKSKLALGPLLMAGLLGLTLTASAEPEAGEWSKVSIPTEGEPGGWVLASGSDIQHLSLSFDGTLYAYMEGASHHLMKSADGGGTWSETGYDGGAIVDIACSRLDAKTIYLTDGSHIYKSSDGGKVFYRIGDDISSALDANEAITCLDVSYNSSGEAIIFIGTADADDGQFGSAYYLAEAYFGARWTNLMAGDYDVYSIAGSPDFDQAPQIIALVTDETHTYIISGYGAIGDWPKRFELLENNTSNFAVTAASRICFPAYFDEIYELFVGVSAAGSGGDVYQVNEGAVLDLGLDADIISLGLAGEVGYIHLLAGGTSGEVWYQSTSGAGWNLSQKVPSGDGQTYVVLALDFAYSGTAYAATSGGESAFSISRDGGVTWNQLSLIDTEISDIVDLAPSPSYSQDNTLFMLTAGGIQHSLWRSLNGQWERVYSSTLPGVDELERVALPPQYDGSNQVVFIAGSSNGHPAIWKSTDNGQNFTCRIAPFPIDAWAVVDVNSLFIAGYDGSNGLVYRTANSGLTYPQVAMAGSHKLNSIALSPNYNSDGTILVSNRNGRVYWSEDNGASFEALGEPLPELIAGSDANNITVAFDPGFSNNNTVYAASHCHKTTAGDSSAIYRFIIGKSDDWEEIDSLADGEISQLIVSAEGTLYAANSQADGGMERCLNPGFPLGPTFETVTRGLASGATLQGLWLARNQLWSIDSTHIRLLSYYDGLAQPVVLTSPSDEAPGVGLLINDMVSNISLDWEALSGANEYEWQLNYDTDFSSVPGDFEGTTQASSARLPDLDPATTYYWRVRAMAPVLSPWSEKWSFTTSLGAEATAPTLESPAAGAIGVSASPIFQWSAIAGASSYGLVVSTRAAFDNPTILKTDDYALPSNAWQCNINLNYDTTYYWRVRAVNGDTYSAWSAVSAFTTEPASSLASSPISTPSPPPQSSDPNWLEGIMSMGGAIFLVFMLVMMVMLIIMIILVIKVSRL